MRSPYCVHRPAAAAALLLAAVLLCSCATPCCLAAAGEAGQEAGTPAGTGRGGISVEGGGSEQEPDDAAAAHMPLRIWVDEFFFAEGETVLLHEAAAASGGAALVSGSTRNRVLQLKSYQQAGRVDVMWTGQQGCYEAFRRKLNASHAVSCVPGSGALTGKAALAASLAAAYGGAAWGIVPHTFSLPAQYGALEAHLKQEQQAAAGSSPPASLWVLKEDVHRGKGVLVATPAQALLRALDRAPVQGPAPGSSRGGLQAWLGAWLAGSGWLDGRLGGWLAGGGWLGRTAPRHVLAQRFLGAQYLVGGRPFYIRVWAVLMGANPARAYLYSGGVVVFGQQQQQQQAQRQQGEGHGHQRQGQQQQEEGQGDLAAAQALIVNLWTQDRAAAAPWSLQQLEEHVAAAAGAAAASRLRRQLHAAAAASLAAGLPAARRAAAQLPGFQGGSFEVLGLDYLVDAGLRPWLVEVNALPSMARKLVGCSPEDQGGIVDGGSSDGGSSGGDGGSGGSPGDGPGASSSGGCQRDNPFDVQKEGFMRALLGLLTHRHRQLAVQQAAAEAVLQAASAVAAEGEGPPCMGAEELRAVLALGPEAAAAEQLGFVPLTGQVYRSLGCMAARPADGSISGNAACDVLAELAPPAQRQCSAAPGSRSAALAGQLRTWCARLRLGTAAMLARLRHPRVAWQLARAGAAHTAAGAPHQLQESDQRLLAWMQRGSPALDTPQAVHQFCAAPLPSS